MSEHNDYIDTTIAESYRTFESDIPEPLDNWSVEDFEDVIRAYA